MARQYPLERIRKVINTVELLEYLHRQKKPLVYIDFSVVILWGLAKAYTPWPWLEYAFIGLGLSCAGALVAIIDIEQKIKSNK
ncbi:MAG: hypothetical protein Q8Q05_01895 [bacterium]|nr:hypothetical protein [bacterium]